MVEIKHASKRRIKWGVLLAAFILGILAWASFNTVVDYTSKEEFCISCHTMRDHAYQDYRMRTHAVNPSGVRATCRDCHVPEPFVPKMIAKIGALNDVWHEMLGTIDTPKKYEARKLVMAQRVWNRMKATDSRECRSCHTPGTFDYMRQERRASQRHQEGFAEGQTCIDCHKGVAHSLPSMYEEAGAGK